MASGDPVLQWKHLAQQAGAQYGIPPNVLLGLIKIESGGVEGRTSTAQAGGLTQFIPGTAREYGVDVRPGHARSQIFGAAKYLSRLGFSKSAGDALASYNAGPGNKQAGRGYAHNVLAAARSYQGAGTSSGSSGGGGSQVVSAPVSDGGGDVSVPQGADVSAAVAALLSQSQAQAPPVSAPAAPAHAAHAAMPRGFAAPPSGGPAVAQGPDVSALLDAVRTQGGDLPSGGGSDAPGTRIQAPGGSSSVGGAGGSVVLAPNANRPGVNLTPGIEKVLRTVSARIGHPLTVGTGTRHNRLTVDGNVSDHYDGNAADLPTSPGEQNIRLGRNALVALGVPRSQAEKATGGIYNLPYGKGRRIQVIFNTNEGGNHHDHVHVGVTALRRR